MNIERNSLCPCGSNKKYKKCCLTKSLATQVEQVCQEEQEWQDWFKKDIEDSDPIMNDYDREVRERCMR